MDWIQWLLLFWIVFAICVAVTSVVRRHRKHNPKIEFKCLEHMVPLDHWNPVYKQWECPRVVDGCEVVVGAETRLQYEGIRPPS